MRNAEGNRNDWFAYTQADNDKWGWASAPETTTAPTPVPVAGAPDADHDGVPAGPDCDDANSKLHSGV